MEWDIQKNERESTKERYIRLLGNGSPESLIQLVKEGEADIAAGRTYSAEEVKEHFQRKKQRRKT